MKMDYSYSDHSSSSSKFSPELPPPCSFSSLLLNPDNDQMGLSTFPSDFNLKLPKPEPIEANEWDTPLPEISSLQQMGFGFPFFHDKLPILPASTKRGHSSTHTPSSPTPSHEQARKRRKTITEKTRSLIKLMPWEKKMDTATVLAEAYKYIEFLQAQVSVLQSMPYQSMLVLPSGGSGGGGFGMLEKLNRQQLLQVLVNSPAAQTVLAAQGNCVYSLEQLVLLKKGLMDQMALLRSS